MGPEQIIQLMLQRGELAAEDARQYHANQELLRQNKHRVWKNTLKALATFGPLFIPGIGPFGDLIGGANTVRRTVYGGPSQWDTSDYEWFKHGIGDRY